LALLASQTTVLNGNLEPVWSPPTTTVTATTNEDESPAATDVSTTNTTMPITWETDWENVVHDLRGMKNSTPTSWQTWEVALLEYHSGISMH
jgi:hypothetical protein